LKNILAACPYPVKTVIGGFHLLDGMESEEELIALGKRLINYNNSSPLRERLGEGLSFYTGHCTGDKVFEVMKIVMREQLQSLRCGTTDECISGEKR